MSKKRIIDQVEEVRVAAGQPAEAAVPSEGPDFALAEAIAGFKDEWAQAGISNAFLFGKIMTANPDLLLELLQYTLPEMRIQSIRDVGREIDIKFSFDAHGVRLDVSATDNEGRKIDVEMQIKDEKDIPRRMRYYSGAIDQTILEAGTDYNGLVDTAVVFITLFDPFGKGFIRYTFRNLCLEDSDLELQDGTTKVILNAAGVIGDVPEELEGFLKLVAGLGGYEEGSFADRVQKQVIVARKNAEWRRQYMDWKMTLRHERNLGREEGREEGILIDRIEFITRKVKRGMDLPAIADVMDMDQETIRPIWETVREAAPDYDQDEILRKLLPERNHA